ncbi:MAG TPA: amidohydrolase family protein [Hyphomonadaceae bacterium]|nr:amidohydrolase family protein [Hyphomonadaceae bacterium]HPI47071.1 amidohydrolase family protein [Hyphomonadaceae bacterium]
MHLHARRADYMGPSPPPMCAPFAAMPRWDSSKAGDMTFDVMPPCANPIPAAMTDEQVMRETFAVMKKRNIIGMISGDPDLLPVWKAQSPERMIAGLDLRITEGDQRSLSPDEVRKLHGAGAFQVLGEIMAQYEGVAPDDKRLEPYWALAEELDIPVGIHMGAGGPGDPYFGAPGYRASNSSAFGLEEVLVRHPKLRVYVMHAGYPLIDDLRAVMFAHPQLYVDISSIDYTEPREAFYAYLKALVDAGYGDRIMFGSDQMIWPGVIEPAIQAVEEAPFLSPQQKRNIFYNNAARFLRFSKDEIARHNAM